MNMFDEANAINTMLKIREISRAELSNSLGVSVSYIANKLRLLKLSDAVKEAIIENNLTERHARLLLKLKTEGEQLSFINTIVNRHFTVAESEAFLEITLLSDMSYLTSGNGICKAKLKDDFVENIKKATDSLCSAGISSRVSINYYDKKSYITIIID